MAFICILVLATGLVSLYFSFREGENLEIFGWVTKLVTASAMYLAFRFSSGTWQKASWAGFCFA